MLLLGANSTGSHASGDIAEAVDFDGTNDYLSRASDLTGNADGKTFTFSAWVWPSLLNLLFTNTIYFTRDAGGTKIGVELKPTGLAIEARNSAGTFILKAENITFPSDTHFHLLCSIDLSSTSNRAVYVNDQPASVTWTTYTNDTIRFTSTLLGVGAGLSNGNKHKGRLAHLYLDYTYRDLSVEANRRLFITADRKPADNQAALNPILYLPMTDPSTVHINEGTGGNFTLNGVVARSGRGPNQFNAPYSDLDGSADYLSRTNLPGVANGKYFTFSCVVNIDNKYTGRTIFHIGNDAYNTTFVVRFGSTGSFIVLGNDVIGNTVLYAMSDGENIIAGRNYHLVVSGNAATGAIKLFVNGLETGNTYDVASTNDIYFATNGSTGRKYHIGNGFVSGYLDGKLGNVFFHTSYIDLSVPSNLAKFCTGTGIDCKPVDMGANGELPLGTSPLIYLPMYANNAGKNYGTGGDFTVNSGPYTGARGPNEFWGNKADFGSSNSNVLTKSNGVGLLNSGTFSLSKFITLKTLANRSEIFGVEDNKFSVYWDDGIQKLIIRGVNQSSVEIYNAEISGLSSNTAYCIQISADLSNAAKRFIYVNGSVASVTYTTYTINGIVRFGGDGAGGSTTIGAKSGYGVNSILSEFYFTTDYIDFSQESNRLKFRDAFGNPVDLTPQIEAGDIPEPAIYMRFDPANQGKNYGTGGDFVKSGTILDGGQL